VFFASGFDPDSVGSVDPDPDLARSKMVPTIKGKKRKLFSEKFSGGLENFLGDRTSVGILIQSISILNFRIFSPLNLSLDSDWIGILQNEPKTLKNRPSLFRGLLLY
jgi:hypothetical protein